MENKTLRVKVNGGYLVAAESSTEPGIYVYFETDDGNELDLVLAQVPSDSQNIKVYNWNDPYSEEYTQETHIRHKDVVQAFAEQPEGEKYAKDKF